VPVGTAFHERTLALCESLNFKEWSGYYTASVYEMTHEHEYNAIRSTAALIDITPLFKYRVSGPRCQQTRQSRHRPRHQQGGHRSGYLLLLVRSPRQGHRRRHHHAPGRKRLPLDRRRPQPPLVPAERPRLDVQIEDISEKVAALALQGPTSGRLLHAVADADIAKLKYFRVTHGKIAGVPVDISRTGYTGDLGYEIWVNWNDAVKVFDELMNKGKPFDIHAAGMVALDIARIEAGLVLIESGLYLLQARLDRRPEILAGRNRPRQIGGLEEGKLRRARSPGAGKRRRAPTTLAG